MARNFRISINGKSYDVSVEDLGAPAPMPAAPVVQAVRAPAPAAPAPAAPAPVPAAPAPAPAQPASAGGTNVTAPMPGKIWKLHVKDGDSVTEGQLILILEAMKMENEIYSPCGGAVTLRCKEGDSVNTGDVLAVVG